MLRTVSGRKPVQGPPDYLTAIAGADTIGTAEWDNGGMASAEETDFGLLIPP